MTAIALDSEALARVADILNRTIGLDPGSLGDSVLRRAIAARVSNLELDNPGDYPRRLAVSREEIGNLIEEVVVPETWFFRDREPFKLMAGQARQKLCAGPGRFHVLSAPCSTGEEPYSATMALLEEGLSPERIAVTAVDISHKALAVAQAGVYGPNSFRGAEPEYAQRYLEPVDTPQGPGFRVRDEVRSLVSFRQLNLVQAACMANETEFQGGAGTSDVIYDAIFCRNFLIYLDRDHKRQVVKRLHSMLAPGGLLFVGHAETLPMIQEYLTPVRRPGAFAYANQPKPDGNAPAKTKTAFKPTASAARKTAARGPAPWPPNKQRKQAPESQPPLLQPAPMQPANSQPAKTQGAGPCFEIARALADQGHLDQAESQCLALAAQGTHTADLYHLLGAVRETRGEIDSALENYGKALYLDPNHAGALYAMALIAERRGDRDAALRYRARLERAAKNGA